MAQARPEDIVPIESSRRFGREQAGAAVAIRSSIGSWGIHGRLSSWLSALSVVIIAAGTLAAMSPRAGADGAQRSASAQTARTLNADDTSHLHLVKASGSLLFEEGTTSGGISGTMRAKLELGATFKGTITIYTRHGTLKGRGSATPHGSGRYESFSGSVVATGGSGLYAHVHGRVALFGTFDRRLDAVVVQTTGTLSY